MVRLTLPIKLESANVLLRMHPQVLARKTALHRGQVRAHLFSRTVAARLWLRTPESAAGYTIQITRLGGRALDSDNLQGACKAVRDGVADALGVSDNDPRIEWVYQQEKSRTPGVRIEIEVSHG